MKNKIICKYCKKEISINVFKRHLKKHIKNYEKKYYDILILNQEELIKDYIDNGYSFYDLELKYKIKNGLIRSYLNYNGVKLRNNSESKKTKKYSVKFKKTFKSKYGVENPSQLDEIKEKKRKTSERNNGYINNFCNPEIKNKAQNNINYEFYAKKIKDAFKSKYGVENPAQLPHVKKILRKKGKERVKNNVGIFSNDFFKKLNYSSSLEKKIQHILIDLNIKFDNNIWLKGCFIDIYIKKLNLVIEVQGDYWHGNPKKYHGNDILYHKNGKPVYVKDIWKKDERKRKKLYNNLIFVEYIWEYDIINLSKNDLLKLVKKIIVYYENKINNTN